MTKPVPYFDTTDTKTAADCCIATGAIAAVYGCNVDPKIVCTAALVLEIWNHYRTDVLEKQFPDRHQNLPTMT